MADNKDDLDLPVGLENVPLEIEDPKPQEKKVPESQRLKDFFFPKKSSVGYGKCECGLEASGSGGRHSHWCPKYKP